MGYVARTFSIHINKGGSTFFRKHIPGYGANTFLLILCTIFYTRYYLC